MKGLEVGRGLCQCQPATVGLSVTLERSPWPTPHRTLTATRGRFLSVTFSAAGQGATASVAQLLSIPTEEGVCRLELNNVVLFVEVLFYAHRNRRLIRDGSPGRPPRLSHSS